MIQAAPGAALQHATLGAVMRTLADANGANKILGCLTPIAIVIDMENNVGSTRPFIRFPRSVAEVQAGLRRTGRPDIYSMGVILYELVWRIARPVRPQACRRVVPGRAVLARRTISAAPRRTSRSATGRPQRSRPPVELRPPRRSSARLFRCRPAVYARLRVAEALAEHSCSRASSAWIATPGKNESHQRRRCCPCRPSGCSPGWLALHPEAEEPTGPLSGEDCLPRRAPRRRAARAPSRWAGCAGRISRVSPAPSAAARRRSPRSRRLRNSARTSPADAHPPGEADHEHTFQMLAR